MFQLVASVRELLDPRVCDLRVPELNLLQVFAARERLDSRVGDLCAVVQIYVGQVRA